MKSRQECIDLLTGHSARLRSDFAVKSLCIFGSVARGEAGEGSDLDVCVEMEPKIFLLVRLKRYLEGITGGPVDVVRRHSHLNPFLKSEIDRDAVYIFQ